MAAGDRLLLPAAYDIQVLLGEPEADSAEDGDVRDGDPSADDALLLLVPWECGHLEAEPRAVDHLHRRQLSGLPDQGTAMEAGRQIQGQPDEHDPAWFSTKLQLLPDPTRRTYTGAGEAECKRIDAYGY